MSITIEDNKLDAVRAEAEAARSRYRNTTEEINKDPKLSEEGKRAEIDQWREATKITLAELREKELKIVDEAIEAREKRIDASMGSSSTDLIAFRDAQDRADRLESPAEAQRILERALRTNDTSLAGAVFRRSLDANWREPIETLTSVRPDLGEAVKDLALFTNFRNNSMGRAMAYTF